MKEYVKQFELTPDVVIKHENPRIHELNIKIEQVQAEIGKLIDKVSTANDVLMEYINKRVKELDLQVSAYKQELSELSPLANSSECNVRQLKGYMDRWDELSFDDKRAVVDQLIVVIKATQDDCEITWKF